MENYKQMKVSTLKNLAKERGILGYSKLRKPELIEQLSNTYYIFTNRVDETIRNFKIDWSSVSYCVKETIRNKNFFLKFSSFSTFYTNVYKNKESFYSFNTSKRKEGREGVDKIINKVLIPFLYYSISEYQNQSTFGINMYGDDTTIINYSFFIFINFFNPFGNEYKNFVCFYKEGYSEHFDFSNTLKNFRDRLNDIDFYIPVFCGFTRYNEMLNFSITFKDTRLFKNINNYIFNVMGIVVIPPSPRNTDNKINADQTFKPYECVICLTNPPNVLFCNCRHIAICSKYDKKKSLENCPVCKTETTIKRTI